MEWPDVQKLAVAYLKAALPLRKTLPVRVVTIIPPDLEAVLTERGGLVRIARGPGSDDGITDSPLLDVETFTLTPSATDPDPGAWDLAEDARQKIHALKGQAVNGVLVDSVTTATAPVWVDYRNPKVDRFVASYRLNLRKR